MENNLEKRYGLLTAISMVVGIVIGSGVFFKAQTILEKTGGNMPLGIIAWLSGGFIMLISALAFSFMATKYEKVNGIVDYAEATAGSKYAYFVGWFLSVIYYPTLTSVLAWASARYTVVLIQSVYPQFGAEIISSGAVLSSSAAGPECMAIALFYLVASYSLNALSPKLAGYFQVSATVIKLVPLLLMACGGIIFGLSNGILAQNFTTLPDIQSEQPANPLLGAIISAVFAYEGWIVATGINAELKNAKKNLPIALTAGSVIVILVYVLYFIGLAGGASNAQLIKDGASAAFKNVFGGAVGAALNGFVVISCLGTLNGLMLGCTRGIYSLAARGEGFSPKTFSQIDKATNMPGNSAIIGLLLSAAWFLYFYGSNLAADKWFGAFCFDSSELPIISLYGLYIPIFIMFMKKAKDLNIVKRIIIPSLALLGSIFMIFAAFLSHRMEALYYLIIFAVIMLLGVPFSRKKF